LEGGRPIAETVQRLVDVGVPVMGHLGLQPQSVHQTGGYVKQATDGDRADVLMADAIALERAGAFAVVLESIPDDVAARVTAHLEIPTIGIAAGPGCDGQVLVSYDMLGLFDAIPPFVKQYAHLADEIRSAARAYVDDVRSGRYPLAPAPRHATTS
jgi:3-methyl-2-oxobutanoate hydroxymethyltransferase